MGNAQLLTHLPQTSVVRPVWRPLIYHHGGAEEVGPNDLPRTHHPTDVCHPEEHVVRFHVKCVAQFLGHLSQAARMCMHLSLIHISEPTRRTPISYAVFCLKKKKKKIKTT